MRSLAIGLSLVLCACGAPGIPHPRPGDPRPIITAAGWQGSECSELCVVDMTIDGRDVAVNWINPPIDVRPHRHAKGRLTDRGLARLAAIEEALADEHPPTSPPMGCIDCPERYLTVRREDTEITYSYDDYSRPPPLTDADTFFQGLIARLIECRPDPNIVVIHGGCGRA